MEWDFYHVKEVKEPTLSGLTVDELDEVFNNADLCSCIQVDGYVGLDQAIAYVAKLQNAKVE
jgi:hypothetical protein